jgi:hypothetical protein
MVSIVGPDSIVPARVRKDVKASYVQRLDHKDDLGKLPVSIISGRDRMELPTTARPLARLTTRPRCRRSSRWTADEVAGAHVMIKIDHLMEPVTRR